MTEQYKTAVLLKPIKSFYEAAKQKIDENINDTSAKLHKEYKAGEPTSELMEKINNMLNVALTLESLEDQVDVAAFHVREAQSDAGPAEIEAAETEMIQLIDAFTQVAEQVLDAPAVAALLPPETRALSEGYAAIGAANIARLCKP